MVVLSVKGNGKRNAETDGKSYVFSNGKMVGVKEKQSRTVRMLRGAFAAERQTVAFEYLAVCDAKREYGSADRVSETSAAAAKLRFKVSKSVWEYNALRNALLKAGFAKTDGAGWNVLWGKHLSREQLAALAPWQRVNHFPGSSLLGRKDALSESMAAMKAAFPAEYAFFPDCFVLPGAHREVTRRMRAKPKALWIRKPLNGSCGRGIELVRGASSRPLSQIDECVVQRYVARPFLIDARKFDLRIYVLVTSFDPLLVYVFDAGMVRFSTQKYDAARWRNPAIHLTNYSIQKRTSGYAARDSKWSLAQLWAYLREAKGEATVASVQASIDDCLVKSILAIRGSVARRMRAAQCQWNQCFELFGFDVLLDSRLRPSLLECNILPSLSSSSPFDKWLKSTLLCDAFHLIGFESRVGHRAGVAVGVDCAADHSALSAARREQLQMITDQFDRQSHFRRLFPRADNIERYAPLFQLDRRRPKTCDPLLWSFLALPNDAKHRVLCGTQSAIPNVFQLSATDDDLTDRTESTDFTDDTVAQSDRQD